MLKYPKEIIRLYRRQKRLYACCAVLAVRAKQDGVLHVAFVFAGHTRVPTSFLRDIQEVSSKAPLSKYGIQPEFSTLSSEDVPSALTRYGLKPSSKLQVYTGGRFYSWSRTKIASDLPDFLRESKLTSGDGRVYPPVLSNISVRVDPGCPNKGLEVNYAKEK